MLWCLAVVCLTNTSHILQINNILSTTHLKIDSDGSQRGLNSTCLMFNGRSLTIILFTFILHLLQLANKSLIICSEPVLFPFVFSLLHLKHITSSKPSWVPRGSVVKCLTPNPGVLGSSRTGSSGFFRGSVLWQGTSEPSLVLVKPRKA